MNLKRCLVLTVSSGKMAALPLELGKMINLEVKELDYLLMLPPVVIVVDKFGIRRKSARKSYATQAN